MIRKIFAVIFGLCVPVLWFARESIKAWFFEKVVHSMNPWEGYLIEYGIPAVFAGICFWLLWVKPKTIIFNLPNDNDKMPAADIKVTGSGNAISVNQSGGQTAHMIINQAPLPRYLDAKTADQIIQELRKYGKSHVEVKAQYGDPEAYQYASKIVEIFKAAGWDVNVPDQSMFTVQMVGVLISIRSEYEIPATANFIATIFKKYGIDVGGNVDSSMPTGKFWLVIGSKPQTLG